MTHRHHELPLQAPALEWLRLLIIIPTASSLLLYVVNIQ